MASNIISETIDAEYPVAGVDNDTQGFRDNFQIIKDGLSIAKNEITALQQNSVKLDETNNFDGTTLASANLTTTTEQYYNAGTVIAGQNISFLNGHYQSIRINLPVGIDDVTLTLADWPEGQNYAKMTVELFGNGTAKTVNWAAENAGVLKTSPNFPASFVVDSSEDPIIVEFWTTSSGNTVYANYLGRFENA